jgi:hypothetical protein
VLMSGFCRKWVWRNRDLWSFSLGMIFYAN